MRAIVHKKYGPPSVLRLEEVAKPTPKANEVLVKVVASAVNRSDVSFRAGKPYLVRLFSGLFKPRKQIQGTEFSGLVESIGSGVTDFKVGDEVFGRSKDESPGAHAEYFCVRSTDGIAIKPDGLTHLQAAVACDGAILANGYLKLVDFTTHPRILVNGASGAIGAAAVQIAKAKGAEVTAVCKTESLEIIQALGVDHLIDYLKEDFTKVEREYDVVFDAVGKSSLSNCRHLIRKDGIYMATELGAWGSNVWYALKTSVLPGKVKVFFPLPWYTKDDVLQVKELVEAGSLAPVVDRVYPLKDIVEATVYVESEEKIGNVVIEL